MDIKISITHKLTSIIKNVVNITCECQIKSKKKNLIIIFKFDKI